MISTAALRREVRSVLSAQAARPAWHALAEPGPWGEGDPRPLYRLLGSHRLLAPSWPRAFGGRDLPLTEAAAVVEEMIIAGVPDTLHTLSVQICGTFLLTAGTPGQRAALLPALAAGRKFCTVLYTEPSAGSDLAALETEARWAADAGWRISGHKLFSVRTSLADVGLVAARTSQESARYQGLTLFLVPLTAPGVAVSRLPCLSDEAFADVRLDSVVVGSDAVVGQPGNAWPLIIEALALERTGVDHAAKATAWLSAAARAVATMAVTASTGDGWRARAGQLRTRTAAARAMSLRCAGELDRGSLSPALAAATKLWCSETAREVADWAAEVLGDSALWPAGESDAAAEGRLEAAYREAPGLVISAGTSEMMRELVAGSGLTAALGDGSTGQAHGVVDDLRAAVRSAAWRGDRDRSSWDDLASIGLPRLGVDPAAGGFGLGHLALVAACQELGACGFDGGVLDTLTVAAALGSAPADHAYRAVLPALLDGSARGAIVLPDRPSRPLANPGSGGLLLVLHGMPELSSCAGPLPTLAVLSADTRGVTCRIRRTMAGDVTTIELKPGTAASGLDWPDPGRRTVIAADLLRRAAWLAGAGTACLAATEQRARSRRQFGRPLLENQVVAHRLADLAVYGGALRALLHREAVQSDTQEPDDQGSLPDLATCAGLLAEAGRFARRAAALGVHLHGAAGMLAGSPPERAFRLIPLAIAAGPSPSLLDQIAASGLEREELRQR